MDIDPFAAVFRPAQDDQLAFAEPAGFLDKDLAAVVNGHAVHAALLCEEPLSPDFEVFRENAHRVKTRRRDRIGGCGRHHRIGRLQEALLIKIRFLVLS